MKDRNVQYPYRFHVRPVPGTDDICEIIPAPGTVYEDGTFWNKQNVLQDAVAALYGKGPAATPNDIFAEIGPVLNKISEDIPSKGNFQYGEYIGTGTQQNLLFDFFPKFFVVRGLDNSGYPNIGIGVGNEIYVIRRSGTTSTQVATGAGNISGNHVVVYFNLLAIAGKTYYYVAIG